MQGQIWYLLFLFIMMTHCSLQKVNQCPCTVCKCGASCRLLGIMTTYGSVLLLHQANSARCNVETTGHGDNQRRMQVGRANIDERQYWINSLLMSVRPCWNDWSDAGRQLNRLKLYYRYSYTTRCTMAHHRLRRSMTELWLGLLCSLCCGLNAGMGAKWDWHKSL